MSAHSTSSPVTPLRIHKQIDPELAQYSDSEPSTVSDNSTNGSLTGRPAYEFPAMDDRKGSPAPAKSEREEAPNTPPFVGGPQQKASPREFWQIRDNKENQHGNLNVNRRSSIERLKKASRVQNNSKLFQLPDAGRGRPLSLYGASTTTPRPSSRAGNADRSRIPVSTPSPKQENGSTSPAPRTNTPPTPGPIVHTPPPRTSSPIKSSLLSSYKTNSYDGTIITTNNNPARRPKSVTFDKEGPNVQEFELVTPEPSIDGCPEDRYDSEEEESSDEEYDLDCAPVMEPDGWRITPERDMPPPITDDPYRSTPSPNGSRPLPPLPGVPNRSDSTSPGGSRPLPSVPLDLRHTGRMSLEERLDLMSLHQPDNNDRRHSEDLTARPHSQILPNEDRDRTPEVEPIPTHDNDVSEESDDTEVEAPKSTEARRESDPAPVPQPSEFQMSRNNIRRQLEERRDSDVDTPPPPAEDFSRQTSHRPQFRTERLSDVQVKTDDTSDEDDMYAIPDFSHSQPKRPSSRFATRFPDPEIEPSEASTYNDADDEYSHYSDATTEITEQSLMTDRENSSTPIQKMQPRLSLTDAPVLHPSSPASERMSLSGVLENDGSRTSLCGQEYIASEPSPLVTATATSRLSTSSAERRESDMSGRQSNSSRRESNRSFTSQDDSYLDDEDTGSVIRHKIEYSDESSEFDSEYDDEEDDSDTETERRSPSPVPDDAATIRAPGGMLKTRASATPADIQAMAAARRQVSGDVSQLPPLAPRIPAGYRSEGEAESSSDSEDTEGPAAEEDHSDGETVRRRMSGRRMVPTLPVLGEFEFDLKLDDLNEEFDKVIEKQKRGYLMRQNTKVIHASSQDMDDLTPRDLNKPGHARGKSWSVEPWRAPGRRRSHRDLSSSSSRKRNSNVGAGAAPPLPGQESASRRLPSVSESDGRSSLASADAESGERGRLFVKVVGVKDLGLPMPQGEPAYFCLTLDNGLHCVTTSWLELAKNAPIGQEFELVVLEDLEFQLTLQAKMEPPPTPPPQPKAAVRAPVPVKVKEKKSAFSKLLSSPKKKRQQAELEQQRLQQQQQQEQAARLSQAPPKPATAWELYHALVGRDGSFARSYISLKDFESHAYGQAFTVDVPCFNEWAVDAASVKSKKGVQHLQPARKAPYKIGKLELQLFYVPRPKNATDNDLPKSMSAAIRELKEADAIINRSHEGVLSQQGGDCPFWRRRYFKLEGARLTAYHEVSRQPRATINLSKASKLIDDRKTLVDPTVPGPGKTRRKSGFSEEEEGYMMVDFGFRIRFGNGEVIDFYADSAVEKAGWMKILGETVGRVPDSRGWCQLVLQREQKRRAEQAAAGARRAAHPPPRPSAQGIPAGRPSTQANASNRLSMHLPPTTRQPANPRTNPQQRPMSYAGPPSSMPNHGPRGPTAHTTGNRMSIGPNQPGQQTRRPQVNFR